jgi:hypothetical protein
MLGDFNCNFILFSCHNIYHYLSQIRERESPDQGRNQKKLVRVAKKTRIKKHRSTMTKFCYQSKLINNF